MICQIDGRSGPAPLGCGPDGRFCFSSCSLSLALAERATVSRPLLRLDAMIVICVCILSFWEDDKRLTSGPTGRSPVLWVIIGGEGLAVNLAGRMRRLATLWVQPGVGSQLRWVTLTLDPWWNQVMQLG